MKNFYLKYALGAGLAFFASCAEMDPLDYQVEKPLSIEMQEELNSLETLKTYVSDPSFKLGAGTSIGSYNDKGGVFMLTNTNFHEATAGYGMKHGAVVGADGELNLTAVTEFIENTEAEGISVYGHTLMWHANQNAEFLNSTIAPIVIPATGGPDWDVMGSNDFETDEASNYTKPNENSIFSFTADGEGAEATGRALMVTNDQVQTNDYDSQLFFTFSEPTAVGDVYRLTMQIKADDPATVPTQAQTTPGNYKYFDFFGQLNFTTDWTSVNVEITINENTAGCNTIAFNLGATATTYYFDAIEVARLNESGGGGPDWEALVNKTFEPDDDTSNYQSNGPNAVFSFTAEGTGFENQGRALKITNDAVRDEDFNSQLFVVFPKTTEVGLKYRLEMDIRADDPATIPTQAHTTPGGYKHYDFFGGINATTEWKHIDVQTTIGEATSGCTAIAFNLGSTATSYYVDNLKVSWFNEEAGGETIIEKTPEEKRDTLSFHLNEWISGIMEVSKSNTHAWDVVNEPMDDGKPYELKTAVGRSEIAPDEFFWQDYLGKDYGVLAFKLAETYGNADDVLFINDYNLEYNLDKCKGIIAYAEYIEDNGGRVDGIGTQMHINIDSDKAKITEMFELLAATGKMIKISELDIGVGVKTSEATEELYMEQAAMYQFVLQEYFSIIPKEQQYGVTIWSPTDSPENSSWRAGEPIGLWTQGLSRKPAYKGVVEGLSAQN
ncbi:endo-1,4-beta-xylanase [Leeuwenhoekiella marinoflava]|uniref:endo-1,4-beta-xylanase n=2 Tax=Leeuwenhoekiella marinoflava TaxID=988 RepID=A0A4Q0PPH2_9FLAO|nr:endo-1,4-beta-xylanase [Leeuwenhoekiella marinoflava]RXG32381.1 glycosyl hydrolase family 10 [Leeuwenhoekiella marinoflava]SHE73830.1 Glycosyl hydrolase family 10 [Leeuwenhoekiella marinoflava DSM 3653]